MMNTKLIATGLMAALLICTMGAICDDSEAAVTERVLSDLYEVEVDCRPSTDLHTYSSMIFIEDSANHSTMKKFIEDPYHAEIPETDDSYTIRSSGAQSLKVHLYSTNPTLYFSTTSSDYYYEGSKVLSKSNISFFVRGGNEVNIEFIDITSYEVSSTVHESGGNVRVTMGLDSEWCGGGDTFTQTCGTNAVVNISTDYGCFAADVTYEASGYVLPNGSSTVFAVAACVIAVTILVILIMCSIHPRWSE